MKGDSRLVWLIILIIVVIVVAVLLFRSYYKTEQERQDNLNKLYLGIAIGIVAVILGFYMTGRDEEQEHGIRDSVRNWWRNKREVREAGQDAKRAAEREAKAKQRASKAQGRQDEALGRAMREGARSEKE